jgi:hypothetical protein
MGDSAGAVVVLLFGLLAFAGVILLAVSLYRLDRQERGQVLTHPQRRDDSAARQDDRRPHAA